MCLYNFVLYNSNNSNNSNHNNKRLHWNHVANRYALYETSDMSNELNGSASRNEINRSRGMVLEEYIKKDQLRYHTIIVVNYFNY